MNKGSTVVLLVASVASGQTWLIRGARVFDGEKIVGTPDVLIRSGKIVAVTPGILPVPDAVVINAAGATLLPGLIDSHVHLTGCDRPDCRPEESIPLRKAALFGVTTVIDLGGALKGFTPREMLERTRRAPAGELSDS
jgi:dihydroorotase-like cyclic amidohydrolase